MAPEIIERMRLAFKSEALDLLPELDTALLALEAEPADRELVNRVFRAIHTIKGSGATAGFTHLAKFTHRLEEAFDHARAGRLAVTTDLIDCGLKACDVIREILEMHGEEGEPEAAGERAVTEALIRVAPQAAASQKAPAAVDPLPPASDIRTAYQIVFRPNRELFGSGTDPVTLLDELRELGSAHITAHTDQVPVLSSLDPESCYLWWEILLVTGRGEAAIQDVFVFVEDDCEILIRVLADQASAVAVLGTIPGELLELFVLESGDHLALIESHALALERDPTSVESLDALFRSVHTIKGNTGVLLGEVDSAMLSAAHPLPQLKRVAHAFESLLEPFRGLTAKPLEMETIQTALDAGDAMRVLLESMDRQSPAVPLSASLLERLDLNDEGASAAPPVDERLAAFVNTASQCMEMIGMCLRSIESDGDMAASVLQTYVRGLKTLGAAASYQQRPDLEEPVAAQLRILEAAMRVGGAIDQQDAATLSGAFESACSAVERAKHEKNKVRNETPEAPGGVPASAAAARPIPAAPSTIRIEQEKLDRLMRVVGELLVARGAFPVLVQKLNDGQGVGIVSKELKEAGSGISRIADELQNCVMSIRMLPVKTVFQKFPRLVRDLAQSLGKEVQFVMEGESIELDKTILEQIGDPLVHLIRNAIDHGLEAPVERTRNGKNPAGRVTLRARSEAGAVVIQIVDDGPGLDSEALKRKAVEKGLLSPDAAAAMDEMAAFQLIFLPGLSTAQKVTDVSGRGVGMDVVKNNIRNLQGTINIESKRGSGTTFSVKLPTSLMIAKGILLQAGSEEYVLPLGSIRDMVKIPVEKVHRYHGTRMVQVRGEIYPVFALAELFGFPSKPASEVSIAIVEAGSVRYGLMVDQFVSEVEVIVKPLGGLEECREFQGAAIMGDGRLVLVLNALECHRMETIDRER